MNSDFPKWDEFRLTLLSLLEGVFEDNDKIVTVESRTKSLEAIRKKFA